MSAFIVSKEHIEAIVAYAQRKQIHVVHPSEKLIYSFSDPEDAVTMQNALVDENYRSIYARYGDKTPSPMIIKTADMNTVPKYSDVAIYKACQCLEYQSCEHDDYRNTFGYRILSTIQNYAADEIISKMPEYDKAAWEIHSFEPITTVEVFTPAPLPVSPKIIVDSITPEMPKTKVMNGVINVAPLVGKAFTRYGKTYEASVYPNEKADICKGEWIRIYGIHEDGTKKTAYDKTFKIGDMAEYHSYNFSYLGKIVAIGEKTVKIDDGYGSKKTTQLSLHDFTYRNWDLDLAKKAEERANWYD